MDSPPPITGSERRDFPPIEGSDRRDVPPTPTPTFTAEQLEWLIPRLGPSHPAAWRAAVDPVLGPATNPLTSGLGLDSAGSSSAAEILLRDGLSNSSLAGEQ